MPASYIPESLLLKPRDPSIKDNNDWPIFTLLYAEVRNTTIHTSLTSILNAHAASPLTVTGRLQPAKSDQYIKRVDHPKPFPIQIENVCEFSYGYNDDGQILVWAAGNAGWFELHPNRAYKDIFAEIEEAVTLQFFIEDVYEPGSSKSAAKPTADSIFRELAEDKRFTCSTPSEAAATVAQHRNFLLMQLLSNKPNRRVAWSRTPLYTYMKTKYPTEFQTIKTKLEGRESPHSGKSKGKRSSESDVSMSDEQPEPAQKVPAKTKSNQAPKKDALYWQAKIIWETIQRAHVQGHVDATRMTIADVATVLYHRYEIESSELANSYIRTHTSLVRYFMQQKALRKKNGIPWTRLPLYKELGSSRLIATKQRLVADVELKPRKHPLPMKAVTPEEEEQSPAPELNNREARLKRRAHLGKSSVLRPKSTRFSGKGKGIPNAKAPKGPARQSSSESSEEDSSSNTPSKRKGAFEEDVRPPKRSSNRLRNVSATSNSSNIVTSGTEPTDSEIPPNDSSEENGDDGDEEEIEEGANDQIALSSTLPLHLRPVKNPSTATLAQGIITDPLPSLDANLPGDVWLCTFNGCVRRIYGASEDESKELIQEHIDKHDADDAKRRDKVDLVVREGELGGRLPVGNLIQRIREMTEAKRNILQPYGNAASLVRDMAFPQPISRRV